VCEDQVVVPIAYRPADTAVSSKRQALTSGWDNDLAHLPDWYREEWGDAFSFMS
jgi:hypothetical protein